MPVTEQVIDDMIAKTEFHKLGRKTTVCLLTLENGFEVVGSAACVNPEEYDREVGERLALEDARDEVWALAGYRQQCFDWKVDGKTLHTTFVKARYTSSVVDGWGSLAPSLREAWKHVAEVFNALKA